MMFHEGYGTCRAMGIRLVFRSLFFLLISILCVFSSAQAESFVGVFSAAKRDVFILSCTGSSFSSEKAELTISKAEGGQLLSRRTINPSRHRITFPKRGKKTSLYLLELSLQIESSARCRITKKNSAVTRKKSQLLRSVPQALPDAAPVCMDADINGDGEVNGADLSILIRQLGQKGDIGDINGDGRINGADLSVLMACLQNPSSSSGSNSSSVSLSSSSSSSSNSSSTSSASSSQSSSSSQGSSLPILVPGSGFGAPTTEPPANCSSGPGCTARPAARWDVVPFQTFQGNLDIGVVAFHINGIARVSFSANGGPWKDVHGMTQNVFTGVTEYTARLEGARFQDGRVEVRAIAYPISGTPRVLEPLFLSANFHGTLPTLERFAAPAPLGDDNSGDGTRMRPFRTIFKAARSIQNARGDGRADGGIVSLLPGSYSFGGEPSAPFPWYNEFVTVDRWLVIRPASGVQREQVVIDRGESNGFKTKLVKVESVTVRSSGGSVLTDGGAVQAHLWLDNSRLIGPGRGVDMTWEGYAWSGGKFVTRTHISDARGGITGARLQRDVLVEKIGSDAFSNSALVINSEAKDVGAPPGSQFHPDIYQFHGTAPNVILYGVHAVHQIDSQGIFIKDTAIVDVAIVDCHLDVWADDGNQPQPGIVFEVSNTPATSVKHLYVKNSSFVGPANWNLATPTSHAVIEDTTFVPDRIWQVPGLIYR